MNDNEVKKDAVILSATQQFQNLLETHFGAIGKAAQESFIEDSSETEPKAKAQLVVEWDALAMAPKVAVKIGWSVRYKDESEAEIDPLQSKLGLEEKP
jgi:hypothetical protein